MINDCLLKTTISVLNVPLHMLLICVMAHSIVFVFQNIARKQRHRVLAHKIESHLVLIYELECVQICIGPN